jgi:hypothetical protein
MSKRDIGAGWKVVEVVDSRVGAEDDLREREDELGFSLTDVRRCYCCDSEIRVLVFIRRGTEEQMVGETCARKARLGTLPKRTRARKVAAVVVAAAPVSSPALDVDTSAAVMADGTVNLLMMLELIEAAEAAA